MKKLIVILAFVGLQLALPASAGANSNPSPTLPPMGVGDVSVTCQNGYEGYIQQNTPFEHLPAGVYELHVVKSGSQPVWVLCHPAKATPAEWFGKVITVLLLTIVGLAVTAAVIRIRMTATRRLVH